MQKLLIPSETAEVLGVPERTLSDWRLRHKGPPWLRVGRHVRYPAEALDAWIESRTMEEAS